MNPRAHNRVEVMHGVNLDQLDKRPSEHYGAISLDQLEVRVRGYAREIGLEARFFDTNHEGVFVERLHRLPELTDGVILNPGAWSHYSYAIRDALEVTGLPAIEVHLSDVRSREEWRRHSVLEGLVIDTVFGKGPEGYREALEKLKSVIA